AAPREQPVGGSQDSLTGWHGGRPLRDISFVHVNSHGTPIDRPPCLCYERETSLSSERRQRSRLQSQGGRSARSRLQTQGGHPSGVYTPHKSECTHERCCPTVSSSPNLERQPRLSAEQ